MTEVIVHEASPEEAEDGRETMEAASKVYREKWGSSIYRKGNFRKMRHPPILEARTYLDQCVT